MRRSGAPSLSCPIKQTENVAKRFKPDLPSTALSAEPKSSCESGSRFFSTVWGRPSTRKHKRWEGDAVLVVSGKSMVLKDSSGTVIASGSRSSNKKEVLEDGARFPLGSKEVELQSEISAEEYQSFINSSTNDISEADLIAACLESAAPPVPLKPFVVPVLDPSVLLRFQSQAKEHVLSLHANLYDADAGGAFVLPRPSPTQARRLAPSGCEDFKIVDVVIDPRLAQILRPHQREGVVFLYECLMGFRTAQSDADSLEKSGDADLFSDSYSPYSDFGAILADEMGLGKTLQCITLLWTLLRQGPINGQPVVKKALIIAPCSLVEQWKLEFKKWLGDRAPRIIAATKAPQIGDCLKAQSATWQILIMSYDLFVRWHSQLASAQFDVLICDEAHRLKNASTKSNCLLTSLTIQRRILLTGTPVQNDLQELFTLCDFARPGVLGSNSWFNEHFVEPINLGQQSNASPDELSLSAGRTAELLKITETFLCRRTQSVNCAFLPTKTDHVVFCKPSELQLDLYGRLVDSFLAEGICGSLQPLPCIDALRKLCNHPVLLANALSLAQADEKENVEKPVVQWLRGAFAADFDYDAVNVDDSGKLAVLIRILASIRTHSPNDKIVIVSNFTQTLDLLESMCEASDYTCVRLDGNTPSAQRHQIVATFNSSHSSAFIFLLSSKAGGVGLNLTGASRLILYDSDWNPANDLQAMARIWREGQTKPCHVYRLLTTGTIEEKIFQRQIKKRSLSASVDSAVASVSSEESGVSFTDMDLKDIFSLDPQTPCQTHDLIACHCDQNGNKESTEVEKENPSSDNTVRTDLYYRQSS